MTVGDRAKCTARSALILIPDVHARLSHGARRQLLIQRQPFRKAGGRGNSGIYQ